MHTTSNKCPLSPSLHIYIPSSLLTENINSPPGEKKRNVMLAWQAGGSSHSELGCTSTLTLCEFTFAAITSCQIIWSKRQEARTLYPSRCNRAIYSVCKKPYCKHALAQHEVGGESQVVWTEDSISAFLVRERERGQMQQWWESNYKQLLAEAVMWKCSHCLKLDPLWISLFKMVTATSSLS